MRAVDQRLPGPSLQPLRALLDEVSIVEHAEGARADVASGHCVDDAGRALAVACRAPTDAFAGELAHRMLAFLAEMHLGNGRFRLRDNDRTAETYSADACGRAIHGLGVAAGEAPWTAVRDGARSLLDDAAGFDTPYIRACAHASLGAAAAGASRPEALESIFDRTVAWLERPGRSSSWPWPDERLTYGNALIPDALIAIAVVRDDRPLLGSALELLDWLLAVDSQPGHLSPTPVGGWAPGEPRPGFDQQPIEAWALADACRSAVEATGDVRWGRGIELAAGWFAGDNDVGARMWDPASGRSFDGLTSDGVNRNQGAESALALVATSCDLAWLGRWARRPRQPNRQAASRSRSSTR